MGTEQPQDDPRVTWEWLCAVGVLLTIPTTGDQYVELTRELAVRRRGESLVANDRTRSLGHGRGLSVDDWPRSRFRALYYALTGEQLEE
jgi:hypothetical protein